VIFRAIAVMSAGRPKNVEAVVWTPGSSLLNAATKIPGSHARLSRKCMDPWGKIVAIPGVSVFPMNLAPFSWKNPTWKLPCTMKVISVARG